MADESNRETQTDLDLILALCTDTTATGEVVGPMGDMLGIHKPSDEVVAPWVVELVPIGDGAPMAVRVKLALKTLLRRHGLRAVRVRGGADVGTV